MKCKITKSDFYGKYCVKQKCNLYPCSQLKSAHRKTFGEVVLVREFKAKSATSGLEVRELPVPRAGSEVSKEKKENV